VFLWLFFAAFIIGIYFWNYQKPDYHPDLWYALRHPFHLVAYISVANWRFQHEIRDTVRVALLNWDLNNPVVSQIVPEFIQLPLTLDFLKRYHLSFFQNLEHLAYGCRDDNPH